MYLVVWTTWTHVEPPLRPNTKCYFFLASHEQRMAMDLADVNRSQTYTTLKYWWTQEKQFQVNHTKNKFSGDPYLMINRVQVVPCLF